MTDREQTIFNELRNDPELVTLTNKELMKIVQEIIEEGNLFVKFQDNRVNLDFQTQFEASVFFNDNIPLGGLYGALLTLARLKIIDYKKQSEMPDHFGLAENTYYKLRNELEKLGFIRIEKRGNQAIIRFNKILRLTNFELPNDPKESFAYLKKQKKAIVIATPNYLKQQEELKRNKLAQTHMEGLVQEKVEKIEQKKVEAKKKEEKKFSPEDYNLVLNAFKKYKRVGLMGPEVNRAKHAIKQMFLAQRSVKDIIDCIKFFSEHQTEDQFKWMQHWTLETIMKKMPEFVAGELKSNKIGDDIPDY